MGSELRASAVRLTEAALQGVGEALGPGQVLPGLLLTPLARMGDALRLGVELPRSIRRWSDALERRELQGALAALLDETAAWTLPIGLSAAPIDDPGLTFVVWRRDEAESVRHAVRRICLPKQLDPFELAEFATLETVLVALDRAMGALLSRADVGRLLGTRAAMEPAWADGFQGRAEGSQEERGAFAEERWRESIQESVPSDELITRYVTRGAMSRYVEGVAAANTIFAGDLAACIDALLEAREDVGLIARRWRTHARVAPSSSPLRFAAIPPLRLAAATAATAVAKTTIALGVLSPLDAEGRFEVSARELMLQVFEGEKPIERVELGGQVAMSPVAPNRWELAVPVSAGPVRLRIVSTDGSEISEELRFDPVDSSDEAG